MLYCQRKGVQSIYELAGHGNRGEDQGEDYTSRPGASPSSSTSTAVSRWSRPRAGASCRVAAARPAELPEETLRRETREECGFEVKAVRRLGEAVEYVHTAGHTVGQRKECVFFAATVNAACGVASEADHTLLWLEPREAQERLAHGSQRWAVARTALTDL